MARYSDRVRSDSGGALIVALLVTAVCAAMLMAALGDLGGAIVDRTRAASAADSAALAGLWGGARAAERIARLNDAHLVSFHEDPVSSQVTVVVVVGEVTATARATDAP